MSNKRIIKEDISDAPFEPILNTEQLSSRDREWLKFQEEVENYNSKLHLPHEVVSKRTYLNNNIVVRLRKKDFAHRNPLGEGLIKADNKIKIQNPDTGRTIQVNDPVPFILEGVIIAMDNAIKDRPNTKDLCVGSRVQLLPCDIKNFMYFPRKEQTVMSMSTEELYEGKGVPDFEGLFIINPSMIESYE